MNQYLFDMNLIDKIKEIILDNNYFDTLAGECFKEWNDIKDIDAVISFSGRSKNQECYRLRLSSESDSDVIYVSHLYIDKYGSVKVQLTSEDTDDINVILHPSNEPIENYDDEIIREWINLLSIK